MSLRFQFFTTIFTVKPMMEQNSSAPAEIGAPDFNPVLEGERLFSEGRLDEARAIFQAAAEACPGNALAYNNLAVIAMTENQPAQAEGYLRQALEVKSDFLEARYNLVEVYCLKGQWKRAAGELKKILEIKPSETLAVKRLAQVYMSAGEPEKARQLLEESKNIGALRAFIDSLWLGIKYCAMNDELAPRDKLEKFTAAVLRFLDGQNGQSPKYRLVTNDPDTGEEVVLEDFFSAFYYKEDQSPVLAAEEQSDDAADLVLTIGEHDDWLFFRAALRDEMRAEGGCLGDFTQTRKVMRREARLAKYNLAATLKYFQNNVGPCDCHVLRAVLV